MQVHDIQCCQLRDSDHEQSRHDGKILGNIVRDTECSQCSARHQQLFTDFNDFDELGRVVVEISTIFPASLAACVPLFMATPTFAW